MRWDDVLEAVGQVVATTAELRAIFPADADIRLHGTGTHHVPLLEHRLISDVETELWEPAVVQWDIWVKDAEQLTAAERTLRRLFHAEGPVTIGGIEMVASEYIDGDTTATPDLDGYFGRAVRFRHQPLRERYAQGH